MVALKHERFFYFIVRVNAQSTFCRRKEHVLSLRLAIVFVIYEQKNNGESRDVCSILDKKEGTP